MSVILTDVVYRYQSRWALSNSARSALANIAFRAENDGTTRNLSVGDVMRQTCLGRTTIFHAIAELHEQGFILGRSKPLALNLSKVCEFQIGTSTQSQNGTPETQNGTKMFRDGHTNKQTVKVNVNVISYTEEEQQFVEALTKQPLNPSDFKEQFAKARQEVSLYILIEAAKRSARAVVEQFGDNHKLRVPEKWLAEKQWVFHLKSIPPDPADKPKERTVDDLDAENLKFWEERKKNHNANHL